MMTAVVSSNIVQTRMHTHARTLTHTDTHNSYICIGVWFSAVSPVVVGSSRCDEELLEKKTTKISEQSKKFCSALSPSLFLALWNPMTKCVSSACPGLYATVFSLTSLLLYETWNKRDSGGAGAKRERLRHMPRPRHMVNMSNWQCAEWKRRRPNDKGSNKQHASCPCLCPCL